MRWFLSLLLLFVLLADSTAAQAAPPRKRADALFRRASRLYKRGRFRPALKLFKRAQRIYPSYKLELSIGYTYAALKRPTQAASYLERSLSHASSGSKAMRAARKKLGALRRKLGSVSINGAPEGSLVRIDGKPRGRIPLPSRIYLLPGSYQLLVENENEALLRQRLSLRAGQHLQAAVPEPAPTPAPPRVAAVPPPTAASAEPAPGWVTVPEDPVPPSTPFYKTWWFWSASAAVVGAAVGVVLATQLGGDDRMPSGEAGTIYLDR